MIIQLIPSWIFFYFYQATIKRLWKRISIVLFRMKKRKKKEKINIYF